LEKRIGIFKEIKGGDMSRKYIIDKLNDKKVIKLIYDNDKEFVDFKIENLNKIDIDWAIKALYSINTYNSIAWACKLEILKTCGLEAIKYANNLKYLQNIKQFLSIKIKPHQHQILYKNHLPVAEFVALPTIIVNFLNDMNILKFDKDKMIEEASKYKISDIFYKIYPENYFETRHKIDENEDFWELDLRIYEYLYLLKTEMFKGTKVSEVVTRIIGEEILPKINNSNKKIRITIKSFNADLSSLYVLKDSVNRESLKHFFEMVKNYSLPETIAFIDIKYEDIEFFIANIQEYNSQIEVKIRKCIPQYCQFYINDFINQIKNNKFYGVQIDENGKIVDIYSTYHISNLLNFRIKEGGES
jgi:hypothetical protein